MSYGNMPGPGDAITWGPIRGPRDPRYVELDDEATAAARHEAMTVIADHHFERRMASPAWISDAQGDFENVEYDAITAAIIAGDPMKVGQLTIEATRRAIRRGAMKEAAIDLNKLEREDEADYYAERVTS